MLRSQLITNHNWLRVLREWERKHDDDGAGTRVSPGCHRCQPSQWSASLPPVCHWSISHHDAFIEHLYGNPVVLVALFTRMSSPEIYGKTSNCFFAQTQNWFWYYIYWKMKFITWADIEISSRLMRCRIYQLERLLNKIKFIILKIIQRT